MRILQFLLPLLLLSACDAQPQEIQFGNDQCSLCKMEIIDQRFGAEIVTLKGKNYKFDSGECMANYLRQEKIKNTDVKSLWVINAAKPKQLIDGAKAFYLHSENFPSPMGGNLSAFETQDELLKFKQLYNGDEWNWNDVMQKVR